MSQKKWGKYSLFILSLCLCSAPSNAADEKTYVPTSNMMGELGLNKIPSARMAPVGTTRITVSRQSPYTHATLGFQMTDSLFLGLRQTSESKSINSETLHLYPGMDAKLMLYGESRFIPQISAGVQSAFGHKRMAGEYLALSKRYEDFDFTFGFGWGRMGSRMSLPNPILINAFQNSVRSLDGENPASPKDWFKGNMGLFGGVEYATPVNGLALKADWNSDGWKAERVTDINLKAPAPWTVGLSYCPMDWVDTGLAYDGQNVMVRLTFTGQASAWPFSTAAPMDYTPLKDKRRKTSKTTHADNTPLSITDISISDVRTEGTLNLKDDTPAPEQIGNAARYLSNIAGKTAEQIIVHTRQNGLRGQSLSFNRRDLERTFIKNQGSAEEIWQTTEFSNDTRDVSFLQKIKDFIEAKPVTGFKLNIINDVSLSEEDSGLLYRSAATLTYIEQFKKYFLSYQSLRLNLSDNLEKLNDYRGLSLLPVRSDIDIFTQNRLMIDRSYYMGLTTLAKDLHVASSFGYLEEMYMGLTGEILYRPFHQNWAIGIESALAFKRDPYSVSALAPNGDHILTGFINAYYEPFNSGITLKASAGRFLAGDIGGTLSVSNEFLNGVKLSADISASNKQDVDIYGGKTNLLSGIRVSLPLGSAPYIPDGSRFAVNASPLGRESSQRLDMPTSLYDMTEPLSYRHITRHWNKITPKE